MTLSTADASIIQEAINHLRRLAIVGVQKPGIQAVVIAGYRCKICNSKWWIEQPEVHTEDCILDGSKTC